VGLNNVN